MKPRTAAWLFTSWRNWVRALCHRGLMGMEQGSMFRGLRGVGEGSAL